MPPVRDLILLILFFFKYSFRPEIISAAIAGFIKLAVPTAILLAPARKNSTADGVSIIPPIPIIGILIFCATSQHILTATGLIAGPLNPPVRDAIFGILLFISMLIADSVFIRDTASEPADSAAKAISTISVTLG